MTETIRMGQKPDGDERFLHPAAESLDYDQLVAKLERRRAGHRGRDRMAVGPRRVREIALRRSSSTRPASSPWPMSWQSPAPPPTSCSWATRSSWPSRARGPILPVQKSQRSATSWASTTRCRTPPGSSSTGRTACILTFAGIRPRSSMTTGSTASMGFSTNESAARHGRCQRRD